MSNKSQTSLKHSRACGVATHQLALLLHKLLQPLKVRLGCCGAERSKWRREQGKQAGAASGALGQERRSLDSRARSSGSSWTLVGSTTPESLPPYLARHSAA